MPPLEPRVRDLEEQERRQDDRLDALTDALIAQTAALEAVVQQLSDLKTRGLLVLVVVLGGTKLLSVIGPALGVG